jgi:hypothetical protein
MTRFAILFILAITLLSQTACTEISGIEVRIKNTSDKRFDDIRINNISFGALDQNEITGYMSLENLYQREFIEAVVEGQSIKLVPEISNLGELYTSGQYRYDVDVLFDKWLDVDLIIE